MRRPGSVHKTGGFRLSGGVESWTSPTLVSVKFWLRIETRQCSHQGLRVLIFTDRPGPRAHLVGVYIELRDLFQFSSAVQSVERTLLSRGVPGLVFLGPVVFKETEFFLHRKSVEWTQLSRGVPGLVFLDPVV
ncbi:hypothetical protein AVEN_149178-1, partial [Araneus ventricosus]